MHPSITHTHSKPDSIPTQFGPISNKVIVNCGLEWTRFFLAFARQFRSDWKRVLCFFLYNSRCSSISQDIGQGAPDGRCKLFFVPLWPLRSWTSESLLFWIAIGWVSFPFDRDSIIILSRALIINILSLNETFCVIK